MASPGKSPKRQKLSPVIIEASIDAGNHQENAFTFDILLHVLFGKKENEVIDLVKLRKKRQAETLKTFCHVCRVDRPPNGCPFHEPSSSKTADNDESSLSYAIKSFPPEVQLCTSTIPGAQFGVCAKRVIPEGTWIGPYEGKRVKPEDLSQNRDNSYIWEVYENGQASCYIDGSDEDSSSWMRFIRCARHKEEQNLYAFQYLGNVFYRSFKDIPKGTEMLVWYDDKYPQYMGIPTGLQEIEFVNALDIERSPSADQNRKSPGEKFTQSKENEKEKLEESHRTRQHGHHGYPKTSSVPTPPRSSPSDHRPISSNHSTVSFRGNIEGKRIVSPRRIIEAPLPIDYAHPTGPLVGTTLTYTPAGAYRKEFDPVSHAPVNISAGVPSQNVMGRVPTGNHTGITGAHIPELHQKPMDEERVSAYGSGTFPHHHGNGRMTSGKETLTANKGWVPSFEGNVSLNTSQIHPVIHGHSTPLPCPRHLNKGMTISNNQYEPSVTTPVPTAVVGNNFKNHSQEARPRRMSNQIVSEEALRERGYPVNTSSRRQRSKRRRPNSGQTIMSDYGEENDIYERFSEDDDSQTYGEAEATKATESDSNGSSTSSQPKDDSQGSPIDEISMWRCRQCQKTFTQRVMLQVHVCPHEPFKPYRCGQCELSFDTAPELRSHVDTHASEKPFKCGFCSRAFAGATTLNNHIRTHMGKRPFNCECGKSFAQAGQLARHQRTPGECEYTAMRSES